MKENIIARARRYLAKVPPAIQGSGGDAATLKAAHSLVKGFNLTPEAALPLMQEWNAGCSPPWTESALRAKLASAGRSATPSGYLLQDRESPPDKGADKATKRRQWPAFHKPNPEDLAAIATLRGVSVNAAYLITCQGHVWRCRWKDAECVAIGSGTFAQVRRMDGEPFIHPDGSKVKALNLPGSEGAFLTPGGLGDGLPVILTEGAISILEAAEAILRADTVAGTRHPLAMLAAVSAQSRLTAGHLAKLEGRRVRIIADNDRAGLDAAANWTATLRASGCAVECVRMPQGMKDLGDALRAIPATDSFWQKLLTF